MIGALFRIYSYLFHLGLSLFLLGLSLVAIGSNSHTLNLGMTPFKGGALTYFLLASGLGGLISLTLALLGKLRFLFLIHALVAFGMMFRGYFLTGYTFAGKDGFQTAVWLTVGALLAIPGAWSQFRRQPRRK